MLINKGWFNNKIKEEIKRYTETNKNENKQYITDTIFYLSNKLELIIFLSFIKKM